jgi:hypothetical protein
MWNAPARKRIRPILWSRWRKRAFALATETREWLLRAQQKPERAQPKPMSTDSGRARPASYFVHQIYEEVRSSAVADILYLLLQSCPLKTRKLTGRNPPFAYRKDRDGSDSLVSGTRGNVKKTFPNWKSPTPVALRNSFPVCDISPGVFGIFIRHRSWVAPFSSPLGRERPLFIFYSRPTRC